MKTICHMCIMVAGNVEIDTERGGFGEARLVGPLLMQPSNFLMSLGDRELTEEERQTALVMSQKTLMLYVGYKMASSPPISGGENGELQ